MDKQEWNPGTLMRLSGGYWQTCVLHASVKLDIFTQTGEKEVSAKYIAEKIGCDSRGLQMLLNALSAIGLINKTGDHYSNTPIGKTFLSKNSEKYIGYMILHHHHLMESWAKLDQAVKTGKPVKVESSIRNDEQHREAFLMGMFNTAMNQAPDLVKSLDLSGRKNLLDLGGGPGTYAIHFCLNNPDLKATVFDLPTTRPFAEKTIEKFGLSDRIKFDAGDFTDDEITNQYDAAWLSHILHSNGPDICLNIIKKTVSSLVTGAMIIIHDFFLDKPMDSPLFPALFALNMLTRTDTGQSYSESDVIDMLKKAGVKNIQRTDYQGPTESGIILGYC